MTDPRIQLPGTVPGIDLSGWNRVTDYDAIVADGVQFCWVKASQGNDDDGAKRASEHVRGLEEAGLCDVGVYHFAVPSHFPNDPEIEADICLEEIDDLRAVGLRPALDYEKDVDDFDDEPWIARFIVRIWRALGVLPGLYIGKLARSGKVDIARVVRLVAEATGLDPEHIIEAVFIWSPRYPTAKGTPIEVFQRLAIEQIDRGPRVPGWNVWQWSSSWSPRWASGHIDVNAARDLDALRWQS